MREEWRDIKGYEGHYQVSNLGRVKSLKYGKEVFLKPWVSKKGYKQVGLTKNCKRKIIPIHKLVALSFCDGDYTLQVNHIDGCKSNNTSKNLEWVTLQENIKHADKIGLRNSKGENCGMAKLTWDDVKKIRKMFHNKTNSNRSIAREFGVSHSTIADIVKNRTWVV